jgi:hypothetical protein
MLDLSVGDDVSMAVYLNTGDDEYSTTKAATTLQIDAFIYPDLTLSVHVNKTVIVDKSCTLWLLVFLTGKSDSKSLDLSSWVLIRVLNQKCNPRIQRLE